MTVIKGDWVERQWRCWTEQAPADLITVREDYQQAVRDFDNNSFNFSRAQVHLQERQYIRDDQCWGEWVTIMKSEGAP